MCGIAGKIFLDNRVVGEAEVVAMTDAIKHRGPDDSGVFLSRDRKVGLGQRRLSIIDLSELGHQPMEYMGRYQIVFNGEIYNFQEKRAHLEKEGYTFKSQTDTEVIMALYDKYGPKCLDHLRGMFAFAIYDEKKQALFCARDRVGKKPFKYFFDGKVFMFASELKAILTQKECPREVDQIAIHHYLTLQYCPTPLTGFKDIKKLPPAHFLFLNLKTKKLTCERYWHLDYSHKLNLSESEWIERILSKLDESVKLRLIADVPLGAFLSGGVDSSAIVAMMARHSSAPVKTFSIGFEEKTHNELPFARQIAELFQTDHTEFIVKPNAIDVLPNLVYHYEEPYADSSALPTYYVSKLTREHVTVALNGDGGDENFGGYSRYSVQKVGLILERYKLLTQKVGLPATRAMHALFKKALTERGIRFLSSLDDNYKHRYASYTSYFTSAQKDTLYTNSFRQEVGRYDTYDLVFRSFEEANTPDPMDQALYADITTYLHDDLMAKIDIASMTVALEGRSPFLDHEMLEMTAQIPSTLKLKGISNKKYILKKALEGILPHSIMYRPKKGFSIPIDSWFRHELKEYAYDTLLSEKASSRGIFQREEVEAFLDSHQTTDVGHGHRIWALLTLELWFQKFFDGK
jgi:asparagine synthase (glutamine-hydrolysing)